MNETNETMKSKTVLDADADPETRLDQALAALATDRPPAGSESAAAMRVARALALPEASDAGLTDYDALVPDYLGGRLNDAQRLLFEEEARTSIALRRTLARARGGTKANSDETSSRRPPNDLAPTRGRRPSRHNRWLYALAAAIAVAVAASLVLPALEEPVRLARVEVVEGIALGAGEDGWAALNKSDWIVDGQVLATRRNGAAVLEFEDGSRLEVGPRSKLRLTRERGGNRVRVDHGGVIVQVTPQRDGTFDIATDDLVVAVVGTTLGVSHGTKGSRVSVIEGEVEVRHGDATTSLHAGDQYGTRKTEAMALEEAIAWSRDSARYADLLQAYAELQRDIGAALATRRRHSTRLLELVPKETSVYVAVPNAPATIAEAFAAVAAFRDRLSPDAFPTHESAGLVEETVGWLGDVGDYLGPETVLALHWDDSGNAAMLLLAEARDGLRPVVEKKLRELAETVDDRDIGVGIVDAPAQAREGRLSIWLGGGLLAASASPEVLEGLESTLAGSKNPFRDGELYTRLAEVYDRGAEYLAGADLKKLDLDGFRNAMFDFRGAQTAIAEHHLDEPLGLASLEVRFDSDSGSRVALLDRPGPMGALKFFSPDATLASAVVLPDSDALAAALDGWDLGFDGDDRQLPGAGELAEDLVGLLGGEIAVALDGPLLPEPAWKAVVEVYDQTRVQQAIESWSTLLGGLSGGDEFRVETIAGTAPHGATYRLAAGGVDLHYAYIDGYLVLAGNRATLTRARQIYHSGATLLNAGRFQDLLPHDSYLNFSAVAYARLDDSLLLPLVGLAGFGASGGRRDILDELRDVLEGAAVFGVYNKPDRIRVVANGTNIAPLVGLPLLPALGAGELDSRIRVRVRTPDGDGDNAGQGA